jgi:Flp pilus assembly protein TadG
MVETAIVLSLFFLLLLGLIEISRLGLTSQLLSSAANSGCRVAVINGHTQNDVVSIVQSVLSSGGIGSSSYTLVTSPSDVTTTHLGDQVTVTISVPFSKVSWLSTPLFLGSATITSSATLSSERP